MRWITVCAPWSFFLCLPDDHPLAKRVENRPRPLCSNEPIAIHAGVGRKWLEYFGREESSTPLGECWRAAVAAKDPTASLGAIVGVMQVPCSVPYATLRSGQVPDEFKHLANSIHASGPHCALVRSVKRLRQPIPWRGMLGLQRCSPELEKLIRERME